VLVVAQDVRLGPVVEHRESGAPLSDGVELGGKVAASGLSGQPIQAFAQGGLDGRRDGFPGRPGKLAGQPIGFGSLMFNAMEEVYLARKILPSSEPRRSAYKSC